ncbi:phage filamentation protein Fil family protein [Yersinia pseudotuberculosis]|uniref:phage filamentation protein Fil family protein n=1 Tax=Yersinia pseudotuberculosis TaxID=633 RepID=UPI001A9FF0F7|nr:phage filamentation protein Fil family protein [Yersinia pseudotuberculosis]MBO1560465.1 hypothetical protein [Yersinia pseudotuberculosis]
MTANQCPSLAAMLTNGQQVTHRRHMRGWIETPDGRSFQPKASEVQFVKGCRSPFMTKPRAKPRFWARLISLFL